MQNMTQKQERSTEANTFSKKISNTTYTVKVHFSKDSTETFDDKMKRVIIRQVGKKSE